MDCSYLSESLGPLYLLPVPEEAELFRRTLNVSCRRLPVSANSSDATIKTKCTMLRAGFTTWRDLLPPTMGSRRPLVLTPEVAVGPRAAPPQLSPAQGSCPARPCRVGSCSSLLALPVLESFPFGNSGGCRAFRRDDRPRVQYIKFRLSCGASGLCGHTTSAMMRLLLGSLFREHGR